MIFSDPSFKKGFFPKIGLKLSFLVFSVFFVAFLVATFSGVGATTPKYAGADVSRPGVFGTMADFFDLVKRALADNVTSTVIVGNALPTVSVPILNNNNPIILNENMVNLWTGSSTVNTSTLATTTVTVSFTYTDNNGCSDVFTGGSSSILLYRSGITSSTCLTTQNNQNCYLVTTTTANSCTGSNASANATATFGIYYFAQATDVSSSYANQNWLATIIMRDAANATGTLDTSGVELNTLVAISVSTSSINYGTVPANSDTGGGTSVATTTNSGNSSATISLYANPTLTSGANTLATSSQRYASSSFGTWPGGATQLTGAAVVLTGITLTSPTSTNNVSQATFWGVQVDAGTSTGTYTGINVFQANFAP